MVFKDFHGKLLSRIGLLVLFIFFTCWGFQTKEYFPLGILCTLLTIIQIVVIFYSITKSNEEVFNFLAAIQYDDFSTNYPTQKQSGFTKKLYQEYNKVILKFRSLRNEKESNLIFYKTILQQIDIGIIAINTAGDVKMINSTGLRLFNANRLDHISNIILTHPEIHKTLVSILPRQKLVVKLARESEQLSISISAIEMMVNGAQIKLLSIQNIQSELEENEMEAWQNMMRVMTHEIMNSLTPITSLAASVLDDFESEQSIENKAINIDGQQDLLLALTTIKKRSEGLLHFVDDFRYLSQIPKPKPHLFSVKSLFEHLLMLLKSEFEKNVVQINVSIVLETLNLMADCVLVEQVIINILRNALESFANVEKIKTIEIKASYNSESKIEITISDNGSGIVEEVLEKVFIPFYSTKKTGSGIGLTICKQIMQSHGGNIKISSKNGEGTTVRLIF